MNVIGQTRKGIGDGPNEDSIGWDPEHALAVLADGMGGYACGEVASAIVKETVLDPTGAPEIAERVLRAHERILAEAGRRPESTGMGSTVVAVRIRDGSAQIVWVGDSRAYLWRGGRLRALTVDHSVAERLRREYVSEEEIAVNPMRRVILQALGKETPVPSRKDYPLRRLDWLILCSDGVSGVLGDEAFAAALKSVSEMAEAAQGLIAAAVQNGSDDDISVIVVEHTGPSKWAFPRPSRRAAGVLLAILSGIVAAALIVRFLP
jgi:serine/threonine protein phosphatase PrpC